MVDMNMLLITFFMLCTSMSKPQTMEISMPRKDLLNEQEQNKVKASKAMTILLGKEGRVYYYMGEPDYETRYGAGNRFFPERFACNLVRT